MVKKLIEQTNDLIDMSRKVAIELQIQREKLDDVSFNEEGIKQSKKLLSKFKKQFLKDKCIRVLLVTILVGVLVLVVWAIIDPFINTGNNSTTILDIPRFH